MNISPRILLCFVCLNIALDGINLLLPDIFRRIRTNINPLVDTPHERLDLLINDIINHQGRGDAFKVDNLLNELLTPEEAVLFNERIPTALVYIRIAQDLVEYEGLNLFEWFQEVYCYRKLEPGDLDVVEKLTEALAAKHPDIFQNIKVSLLAKCPLIKFQPREESFESTYMDCNIIKEKFEIEKADFELPNEKSEYEVVANFNLLIPELHWSVDNKESVMHPVAVLPDGRIVIADSSSGNLILWNFDLTSYGYGNEAVVLSKDEAVTAAVVLPDGRLVTGNTDGVIKVWDFKENKVFTIGNKNSDEQRWIYDLAVFPDGRIISCANDYVIRIWDLNIKEVIVLPNHGSITYNLAVLADGRFVSTQNKSTNTTSGIIKVWDLDNENVVRFNNDSGIKDLMILSGLRIVTTDSEGSLKIWDLGAESSTIVKKGQGTNVDKILAVGALDNKRIVTCNFDGGVRVYDLEHHGVLELWDDDLSSVLHLLVIGRGYFITNDFKKGWNIWHVE